jgi:hypothetical protein
MINSNAGDPAANSYASVEQADTYHSKRLHNTEWTESFEATKEKALMMATSVLDVLNWKGNITNGDQGLRWPRSGVTNLDGKLYPDDAIPKPLISAVSELAWELIKGDRTVDSDSAGISEIKVAEIELKFDRMTTPAKIPFTVRNLLDHLVVGGLGRNVVKLERA